MTVYTGDRTLPGPLENAKAWLELLAVPANRALGGATTGLDQAGIGRAAAKAVGRVTIVFGLLDALQTYSDRVARRGLTVNDPEYWERVLGYTAIDTVVGNAMTAGGALIGEIAGPEGDVVGGIAGAFYAAPIMDVIIDGIEGRRK